MKLSAQHLWFYDNGRSVQSVDCQLGNLVGFSYASPDKNSPNEDAVGVFLFEDSACVLAIADGMGGANCGDKAAQAVIRSIAEQVATVEAKDLLRSTVLDAIEKANQEIVGWGIGAGATLVVGLLADDTVRIIHVGDAEAVICSNRGRIKFSTVAHSPVAMALEIGVLDEHEAMHHEDRNIVNNHVGSRQMRIEIGPRITIGLHDTLLLGSDGLFDNLMLSEIVELIRGNDLSKRAENIFQRANERMLSPGVNLPNKPDDLSVLMFRQRTKSPSR